MNPRHPDVNLLTQHHIFTPMGVRVCAFMGFEIHMGHARHQDGSTFEVICGIGRKIMSTLLLF